MNTIKKLIIAVSLLISYSSVFSQQIGDEYDEQSTGQNISDEYNVITTAVPFMTITPDSRAGGMGDVGVGTKIDVWSQHWNASKYALAEKDLSVGISYTPWLEGLGIKDINLIYVAGYKKIGEKEAVGTSLRYFSLGEIPAYNDDGSAAGYTLTPKEYAYDISYSRYLSDYFVMGMTGRFIYSNLSGDTDPDYKPGKAGAADISGTFFKEVSGGDLTVGFCVSNLGSKIAYSSNQKDFIPTNLRIGGGYQKSIDKYNKLGVYMDINKLLVPTPPLFQTDTTELGEPIQVMVGNSKDPNVGTIAGVFQSFNDAPGGFKEEIKEFIVCGGVEYWYNDQFALRGGYFHEAETKGDRKFFSAGAGLRLNVFGLDFAYLIPIKGTSPLANTFRFSLTFDFEGLSLEGKDKMAN